MKGFLINNNKFLFCIYFLFLLPKVLHGQNYIDQKNFFSPESRLKFGSYLYSEEDYLRASVEFREYLKYVDNDTVRFKFATCFYKIGRFQEAADNYKGLFTSHNLQQESKLAYYKSVFFQKNYSLFRASFNNEFHIPSDYKDEIKRLYYISFFFDNSVLPDTNNFFSSFPDSNKSTIKQFYFRKKFPEYKNPTTAALLSGLIPGLGKIYVGEITDGITSLLVTGVLTFLAVDNFKHNHSFRGWLFAGLGAYFYGGNIYGSAAAAQIFNAGVKFNFDNDVKLYFEKRNYLLPEIKL